MDVGVRQERAERGEGLAHLAAAVALEGHVVHQPLVLGVRVVLGGPLPPPPVPPHLLHAALPVRLGRRRRLCRCCIAEEGALRPGRTGARGGGGGVVDEDVAGGRALSFQRHVDRWCRTEARARARSATDVRARRPAASSLCRYGAMLRAPPRCRLAAWLLLLPPQP